MMRLILEISLFLVAFVFSMFMYENYLYGDQIHYTIFWNSVIGANLIDVPYLQLFYISSAEPIFGVVVWAAAQVVEKQIFMSSLNGLLVVLFVRFLRRFSTPVPVILSLLSNYYLFVLLIPAERIKVAILFQLLGFLLKGKFRYVFLVLAPLTHVQALITYFIVGSASSARGAWRAILAGRLKAKGMLIGVVGIIAILLFVSGMQGYVLRKFSVYESFDFSATYKSILFMFAALLSFRNPFTIIGAFFPIIVAAYLVGGERITVMAFFTYLYFMLSARRFWDPILWTVLLYFSFRGIVFVNLVVENGTAFGK